MAKVLCILPGASSVINGVRFVSHALGMVSEEISDEVAAGFAEIGGFALHEPSDAPVAPVAAAAPPAPPAPAPVQGWELSALIRGWMPPAPPEGWEAAAAAAGWTAPSLREPPAPAPADPAASPPGGTGDAGGQGGSGQTDQAATDAAGKAGKGPAKPPKAGDAPPGGGK